jgi:Ser/Thr protein kinase RdoA (MazF antagonist)
MAGLMEGKRGLIMGVANDQSIACGIAQVLSRHGARLGNVPNHPSVLVHADLGGNVLYDDASGQVSFIDFGSAMIADPVLDVASLSVLGRELMGRCVRAYPLLAELLEDAAVGWGDLLKDRVGVRRGDLEERQDDTRQEEGTGEAHRVTPVGFRRVWPAHAQRPARTCRVAPAGHKPSA